MKSLQSYIIEELKHEDIFNNIDPSEFKWKASYADDTFQNQCKEKVHQIARKLYPLKAPAWVVEDLYKNTYKLYCKTDPKAKDKDIDELYERNLKLINKYGWGTFESMCLEQGWYVFIIWAYDKYK